MPEREGFTPEDANVERPDERIRKTDYGWQKLDAEGRVMAEHQEIRDADGQLVRTQEIIVEYGQPHPGSKSIPSIERGHVTDFGPDGNVSTEKDVVREHPQSAHMLRLKGRSDDGIDVDAELGVVLTTLGSTVAGAETNEPWARFEAKGPLAMLVRSEFDGIEPEQGQSYRQLNGDFGSADIEVSGRKIHIDKIGRISIDFDPEGKPTKATIHKIEWHEVV